MAGETINYPGTQVIERPFQPNTETVAAATAVGGFIGRANQGPVTPFRVSSWAAFVSIYGTNYTDLHNAVSDFFANGGTRCYIQRIVGANSSKGAVNIYATDAPEDPLNPGQVLPGTPPLITAEALNPGAWGNQLHIVINARDATNKRFDVFLFRMPTTVTFDPSKRNSEYLVEQWPDVSLDPADSRHFYDIANAPSGTGSSYVRWSGQTYNPATPLVRPYPQSIGFYKMAGGVDGSYVDVSYDNDAAYIAGIDQINTVTEPVVLNIPNVTDADIIRYAVTVAAAKGNMFVIIDPPLGKTASELGAYADTDLAIGALGVSTPSYGAIYAPWCYLPSVGSTVTGKTTLRPPGGAVVGLCLATDATYGVQQSPAGSNARVFGAIDVETKFNNNDRGLLNDKHVNVIMPSTGNGIVVFGARTLKKSGKDMYVPVRRSMIYIAQSCQNITEFAPFKPNGPALWQDIRTRINKFLGGFWSAGGLKGATASQAWFVRCDDTNNTPLSIDNGFTYVEVGVSLLTPAEFIIITLGQYDGGTSVSFSNV